MQNFWFFTPFISQNYLANFLSNNYKKVGKITSKNWCKEILRRFRFGQQRLRWTFRSFPSHVPHRCLLEELEWKKIVILELKNVCVSLELTSVGCAECTSNDDQNERKNDCEFHFCWVYFQFSFFLVLLLAVADWWMPY